VIAKGAVDAFLRRQLDSYECLKALTDEELDEELDKLTPAPRFKYPPFKHQKVMFLLGAYLGHFLFFADMGSGKTAVALALIEWLNKGPALVCVPQLVHITEWENQAAEHAPHLKCVPLYGSTQERYALIKENKDADLFVINYGGLVPMFTERVAVGAKGKKKTVLKTTYVDRLAGMLGVVVADESQHIKNIQTWSYKILNRMAATVPHRFGLTGTPHGRDPQDLWSQFHFVDQGLTLGYTMGIFRAAYFNQNKNRWGGYEYTIKADMKDKLHEAMQNRSIRYNAEECNDLPPCSTQYHEVNFPVESHKEHKAAQKAFQRGGSYSEMENAYIRMRMITSGYLPVEDGEGTKIKMEFKYQPKLELLMEMVNDLPDGRKMVVFHEFIHTGAMISRELDKLKVNHTRLYGATKDKPGVLKKFQQDPNCRILVVNNSTGSSGLNLQVANYMVVYEMPASPITHAQMLKRLHRTGQQHKVFINYITMRNSIDLKILGFLREGKNLFEELVEGRASLDD